MVDLRHPLAVLASRMPWPQIEASQALVFAHRDRKGRLSEGADMFGPTLEAAGAGTSNAGRPRLPIRLMAARLYLKHAYNERDETLVERWAQDVYFQFFSGQAYFEPRFPCDRAQISRFRPEALVAACCGGMTGLPDMFNSTPSHQVDTGADQCDPAPPHGRHMFAQPKSHQRRNDKPHAHQGIGLADIPTRQDGKPYQSTQSVKRETQDDHGLRHRQPGCCTRMGAHAGFERKLRADRQQHAGHSKQEWVHGGP